MNKAIHRGEIYVHLPDKYELLILLVASPIYIIGMLISVCYIIGFIFAGPITLPAAWAHDHGYDVTGFILAFVVYNGVSLSSFIIAKFNMSRYIDKMLAITILYCFVYIFTILLLDFAR